MRVNFVRSEMAHTAHSNGIIFSRNKPTTVVLIFCLFSLNTPNNTHSFRTFATKKTERTSPSPVQSAIRARPVFARGIVVPNKKWRVASGG